MVSSKQLYQGLRASVSPVMKQRGFGVLKGTQLGWQREAAGGYLSAWFQADKWGWEERWGSRFTVEFQLAPGSGDAFTLAGRRERIGYLLEGMPELDEMRRMNNAIIERLPGTAAGLAVKTLQPDGTEFVAVGHVVDPEPAVYGRDLWLHYYSLEDVAQWGAYFASRLADFAEGLELGRMSAQGLARERFHAAMGRVQSAASLPEKAAILDDFIRTEGDAHYRAAAEHWLAEVRNRLAAASGR